MNKKYNDEVIKNWGNTESYKEFAIKTNDFSKQKYDEINEKLNFIFFWGFIRRLSIPGSFVSILVSIVNARYGLNPHFSCTFFD